MKKFILFLLVLAVHATYIKADYLNTKNDNICVYNLSPYQNNTGWCYTSRLDEQNYCNAALNQSDLINGYDYNDSKCLLKNDLKITGLTENQWNYLLAVLANILGFTMLFLISFLSVLVVRK